MNELPAPDLRIPADMRRAAMILDVSHPVTRCPRCRHKTRGRLYRTGSVNVCSGCASELALISDKKFKRVR